VLGIIFVSWGAKAAEIQNKNEVCFQAKTIGLEQINCFQVEIARTQEERERGLQLRSSLGEDQGMLFIFPESGRHSFWMKDTLIPLDMIWLDESQGVVDILKDVPVCSEDPCPVYAPGKQAKYVLEVNAGYVSSLNIQEGESANFKLLK